MTEYAPSKPARRFSWMLVAVSALVIVGVGMLAYWFATQGPGQRIVSPQGAEIAHFIGNGNQTTASFNARGQWQVHWQNSGASFSFAIRGDRDLGTVIEQNAPGSGVTSVVAAGTYHLEITAEGMWDIRITQGE